MRQYAFALGYIACYTPFAYLIHQSGVSSLAVLPSTTLACFLCLWTILVTSELLALLTNKPQYSLLRRLHWGPATIAGMASAAILLSSTAAYALPVVVVLTSTIMKAGVLIKAPFLDLIRGRVPNQRAIFALILAVGALTVAAAPRIGGISLPMASLVCLIVYLGGYAIKLTCVEPLKNKFSPISQVNFAITSLTCAVTTAMLVVITGSLISPELRSGWAIWNRSDLLLAGVLSQGTGAFSTLILIAPSAHVATVTLNRAAGVLAGAAATAFSGRGLAPSELLGIFLIISAVVVLPSPKRSTT